MITSMVYETPILVIIGALVGAGINVARGYLSSDPSVKLDPRLILGGFVAGIFAALAAVQTLTVPEGLSQHGQFILGAVFGFVGDFAITKLK